MKYPWREDGRRDIYEGSRFIAVFDRTKPKPRPEGYRDFRKEPVQHFVHATQWIPTATDGIRLRTLFPWAFKEPFYKPAESLEPSQTGEVPPEPSKGRDEPAGGVETASSLDDMIVKGQWDLFGPLRFEYRDYWG